MLIDSEPGGDVHDRVVGGGVRDDDALRSTSGARRVDEVGGRRRVRLLVDTRCVSDEGVGDGLGVEDRAPPVLGGVVPVRDDEARFGELGDADASSYRM